MNLKREWLQEANTEKLHTNWKKKEKLEKLYSKL